MKYYATTGIVSSVLATKWATMVIGVMIILSIYGEHTPMNITKSIALSYALMLPVGLAINYFFPKVYSKSNKDVVIAMLAPLGNLGLLIGK